MANRNNLSLDQQLDRLVERERKVYQQIIVTALNENPKFKDMLDAYRKNQRYLTEAEGLLTPEGFDTQRARLQERIASLQSDVARLDEKRAVAESVVSALRATVEAHKSTYEQLGRQVETSLDGQDMTDEAVNEVIEGALSTFNVEELSHATDPFVNFRAAARE